MKNKIAVTALTSVLACLSGCVTAHDANTVHNAATTNNPQFEVQGHGWEMPMLMPHAYHSHKTIDDYSEQLAMQLMENLNFVKPGNTVAVTSMVELDSSLNKTNIIGNHLSDSLMGELQEFGVAVLNYKLRDSIVVNSNGDFALTRDHTALREWQDIDYVLTGTMTKSYRGVLVHARITGMKSKVVVSSAKILIPARVINSIYYAYSVDGIYHAG